MSPNPLAGVLYLLDDTITAPLAQDDGTDTVEWLYGAATAWLTAARRNATHASTGHHGWTAAPGRDEEAVFLDWSIDAGRVAHDVLAAAGVNPTTPFGAASRVAVAAGLLWRHAQISAHGHVVHGTANPTLSALTAALLRSARWSAYAADPAVPTVARIADAVLHTDWTASSPMTCFFALDESPTGVDDLAVSDVLRQYRGDEHRPTTPVLLQEFRHMRRDFDSFNTLLIIGSLGDQAGHPPLPARILYNNGDITWPQLCQLMTHDTRPINDQTSRGSEEAHP